MRLFKIFSFLTFLFFLPYLHAESPDPFGLHDADFQMSDPISPFFIEAIPLEQDKILITINISAGFLLYKEKIKVTTSSGKSLLDPQTQPKGIIKNFPDLGEKEVYAGRVSFDVPFPKQLNRSILLHYQGCSEKGFCLLPEVKALLWTPKDTLKIEDTHHLEKSNTDEMRDTFDQHHTPIVLLIFLGLGIVLSLSPCVLPMIPIVFNIILGEDQKISLVRSLKLTSVYVLCMALTYAIAGIFSAHIGNNLQAELQKPLILFITAVIFVILALWQFEFFDFSFLNTINNKFHTLKKIFKQGRLLTAGLLGILSALVISPCVTPALIGALVYISQTGDTTVGASALFAFGLGMGLPLMVVAILGAEILHKFKPWMHPMKCITGWFLLAVGLYLIVRLFDDQSKLLAWSVFFITASVSLSFIQKQRISGILLFLISFYTFYCYHHTMYPLTHQSLETEVNARFKRISSIDSLQAALTNATTQQAIALLKVHAKWCLTCQQMEKTLFRDKEVLHALASLKKIELDLSIYNQEKKALIKSINLFGPPALIFFQPNHGEMIEVYRFIGPVEKNSFLEKVEELTSQTVLN